MQLCYSGNEPPWYHPSFIIGGLSVTEHLFILAANVELVLNLVQLGYFAFLAVV